METTTLLRMRKNGARAAESARQLTLSMEGDLDYAIALSLQEQFERERSEEANRKQKDRIDVKDSEEMRARWDPKLIVDKRWELLDPHPNIHDLFVQFDTMFFDSRLVNAGVEVRWSPRMTLCAGVCSYEGRGGLCSVRLSAPLLKLRPRKDLVETLLHEMIHALLFVAERNTDHDGHGPNFCAHMHRINKLTGANITIYHTFRQEVNVYRQHWWRCNGPCRDRPPYYGWVKRAMNREPSPRDPWWKDHQLSCGGTYSKVKEPEGYGKKKSRRKIKTEETEEKSVESKGKRGKKNKSKNIVDMIGRNDGKSTEISRPKLFSEDGHKLATTSSVQISRSSLTDSPNDRRQKMLDAIEKRQEIARSKGLKRKSNGSRGSSSEDIRKFYTPKCEQGEEQSSELNKKQSLNPQVHKVPPIYTTSRDLSYLTSSPGPSHSHERSRGKRLKLEESDEEDCIVIDDTDSVVVKIDEDESENDEGESQLQGMCPVCGRLDIPRDMINSHVALCLEDH